MKKENEKCTTIFGKSIFYREGGDQNGIPVVFVHGNFASSKWFEPSLELLPKGYHGFAIDLPNFGRSDRTEEVSIANYGKVLVYFLRQLGLEGVVLIGHSLGGAVVQNVMVYRSDLISKVILVDPAPPDGLVTAAEVYPILDTYRNNRELLKKAIASVMPTRPADSFVDELVDEALLMNPACFVENAKALEEYNYTESLRGCEIPLLVFLGKLDFIVTEEMVRKFESIMPNVRIEILPDYGHSVVVENPSLFIDRVISFVENS
mgnify:CR=1 FL=1|jgi:branched-chain amino acid transport system permease protein